MDLVSELSRADCPGSEAELQAVAQWLHSQAVSKLCHLKGAGDPRSFPGLHMFFISPFPYALVLFFFSSGANQLPAACIGFLIQTCMQRAAVPLRQRSRSPRQALVHIVFVSPPSSRISLFRPVQQNSNRLQSIRQWTHFQHPPFRRAPVAQ